MDAFEEAFRITRENAKYNIGPVYRTINVPLQALELLHPRYRHRFQFSSSERARVAGRQSWVLDFAEHSTPSIINDGFGGDLLSRGRVWVDPLSGAVLRTELHAGGEGTSFPYEVTIEVEYRLDSKLGVFLPFRMEETYTLDIEVLHGRATYGKFRRFQTSVRVVSPPN